MAKLQEIITAIRERLDAKEKLREQVLPVARQLIRESATLIKNAHRREWEEAAQRRTTLLQTVATLRTQLIAVPDRVCAGVV